MIKSAIDYFRINTRLDFVLSTINMAFCFYNLNICPNCLFMKPSYFLHSTISLSLRNASSPLTLSTNRSPEPDAKSAINLFSSPHNKVHNATKQYKTIIGDAPNTKQAGTDGIARLARCHVRNCSVAIRSRHSPT